MNECITLLRAIKAGADRAHARGARLWARSSAASVFIAMVAALALPAGCALAPELGAEQASEAEFQALLASSFRARGQAELARLQPDAAQAACSSMAAAAGPGSGSPALDPALAAVAAVVALVARLQAEALASVPPPSDGRYLGDWREGEKIAQSGKGLSWADPPATPANPNGGGCYNCHQLAPAELSYGTLGPSLLGYGRLRGVADPASPQAQAVLRYTWAKLYNAWAFQACSAMPRFGLHGVLSERQRQDLMALLLDPRSPLNQAPAGGAP